VPARHVASAADRDELERALSRLTPDQRAVLVLRYYAGFEPADIADVLRLPPGTVRSRLHYAVRAMRSAIEADARPARAIARGMR
jgi:RNA polymerase sigma-70 factor (ECF subfamily)